MRSVAAVILGAEEPTALGVLAGAGALETLKKAGALGLLHRKEFALDGGWCEPRRGDRSGVTYLPNPG